MLQYIYELRQRLYSSYQLRKVKKGRHNRVYGKISIIQPNKFEIGNECRINHNCYINASNGIILGDDVTLSAGSSIISTGIDYLSWANGTRRHISTGGVTIGSHVWIGANSTILPGVSITGEYVVIAAGAVVTGDINQSYCIYGGCPAKIIKRFDNKM